MSPTSQNMLRVPHASHKNSIPCKCEVGISSQVTKLEISETTNKKNRIKHRKKMQDFEKFKTIKKSHAPWNILKKKS